MYDRTMIKVHELCGIEQISYWKSKNNSKLLVFIKEWVQRKPFDRSCWEQQQNLCSQKGPQFFTYEFKKSTNLGKVFCYLKFIKGYLLYLEGQLSQTVVRLQKASEFVDVYLKPIMQSRNSYIRGSSDCANKIKSLKNIRINSILVTTDVVVLYPSILHELGLNSVN